jgi:hypothetical protein
VGWPQIGRMYWQGSGVKGVPEVEQITVLVNVSPQLLKSRPKDVI